MTKRILIVDDDALSLDVLEQELTGSGYTVHRATSGEEAMRAAESFQPDVILLDYVMPGMDGLDVLQRLRQNEQFKAVPVILVTGRGAREDKVRGLEAGADDYVVKPFDPVELLARVRSMLRLKELHDVEAEWTRTLEDKVRQQVDQIKRMGRLTRYVSPQIAKSIMEDNDETVFTTHRREITAVAVGLQGFTVFSDGAEPEEVMALLNEYHAEMGRLVFDYEGTLERFAGDSIGVFFNDPVLIPDHRERAVRMTIEMREAARKLRQGWLKRGLDLDVGIGLVSGFATLGPIGFEGRIEYGAIGKAPALAARLAEAGDRGQILTDQKTLVAVEALVNAEPVGDLQLKGFGRSISAFNIISLKLESASGPLSPREREVAALVARGLSNREIAGALYISERTAESHIQSILNKLGFHSRAQVAAWATAKGLQPSKI